MPYVSSNNVNTLRKIVGWQPGRMHGGQGKGEGTVFLKLECGHVVEKSKAEARKVRSLKCRECGRPTFDGPQPEHGPFRNRSSLAPLDPRTQRQLPPGSLGNPNLSDSGPVESHPPRSGLTPWWLEIG